MRNSSPQIESTRSSWYANPHWYNCRLQVVISAGWLSQVYVTDSQLQVTCLWIRWFMQDWPGSHAAYEPGPMVTLSLLAHQMSVSGILGHVVRRVWVGRLGYGGANSLTDKKGCRSKRPNTLPLAVKDSNKDITYYEVHSIWEKELGNCRQTRVPK